MNSRIIYNYEKLGDAALASQADLVFTSLTGNTNFTFPEGSVANLGTQNTTFLTLVNAKGPKGVRINTTEKNNARKVVIDSLRTLGMLVNAQAYGDQMILESSGFKLAKLTGEVMLSQPTDLNVELGYNTGSIMVSIAKSEAARYNTYVYTNNLEETDVTKMGVYNSTATKVTISGLESRTTYKVFAAYMGSDRYNKENEIKYCKSVLISLP